MQRWQERYRDKLVSADEALQVIQPQQTVTIGMNGNIPAALCHALGERLPSLPNLKLLGAGALELFPFHQPEIAARHHVQDAFISVATRPAMQQRAIDFLPFTTSLWPSDLLDGSRPVDVFLTSVSPPDEHGYCSFGFMLWASLDLVEAATLVIAEVDADHIVTYGDNYVHVSQLDYLVEKQEETTFGDVTSTMGFASPSDTDRQIAAHAAALIQDGDTLQLGAGTVSMAVVEYLKSINDLGLHSEICPTGVPQLIAAGNINGQYKTLNPRKAICTALWGDEFGLDFAHLNPSIELRRMRYTNNPRIIAQHDNMVAINNALTIDLTGQITAESFGPHMYSGVGGQLDFTIGAMLAQNGRAVTVLPATAKDGTLSRIVPLHEEGAIVSVPRTYVNYVATEFGMVNLLGRSQRERADRLISIAHPKFQDGLREAAKQLFWP
ncbi:MAG: 4-hydroxybutyrate CoA-transferase [Candidatus Tectomicrobia bacterium]|nr:4-hydroxybutyrate CoA-transferase [Candidatus Tectomicrobia bacterium]